MARVRRRVETYYLRGMLEIRPTLHLAVRIAVRLGQFWAVAGSASHGSGAWQAALPAFVVLDLVVWRVLRRSDRFGLAWRLPLDCLDAAFWTLSPLPTTGNYDWAMLVALPLAAEAGARLDRRGYVVPGAMFLVTALAATADGKAVRIFGSLWLLVTVAIGSAFYRYCQHLHERGELDRDRILAAANRRAYLAGQNQVAMGASSAVDAIEGLVPVLGRPSEGSALWRLADGWKSQLSATTAQKATYLQVALLEWERDHNRHPDLSGLVWVEVGEGEGTTLLTATQALRLGAALDRLDLRGPVSVRLQDADAARLPGQALRLAVGDHLVTVPAERRAVPPPMDAVVPAYLYVGAMTLLGLSPASGSIPPWAVGAGLAVCAVAGFVSYRRVVADGERARPVVLLTAVVAGALLTFLNTYERSALSPEGGPLLAFTNAVLLVTFVGGFYWSTLGRWRLVVPIAAAGNVVFALFVFPIPSADSLHALFAASAWAVWPFFPLKHLAATLGQARAHQDAELEEVDLNEERAAFLAGRASVVDLVRRAREEALGQLALLAPRLDAGTVEVAGRRLKEVERRLSTIEPGPGWWSSTTTS